jgi:hypothetical protein
MNRAERDEPYAGDAVKHCAIYKMFAGVALP